MIRPPVIAVTQAIGLGGDEVWLVYLIFFKLSVKTY